MFYAGLHFSILVCAMKTRFHILAADLAHHSLRCTPGFVWDAVWADFRVHSKTRAYVFRTALDSLLQRISTESLILSIAFHSIIPFLTSLDVERANTIVTAKLCLLRSSPAWLLWPQNAPCLSFCAANLPFQGTAVK